VHVVRRSNVVRSRRSSVVRRSKVVRRSVVRSLSLSICEGRLRGATWLLLLLRPHGKRIGF
jgi:hypothetical protein